MRYPAGSVTAISRGSRDRSSSAKSLYSPAAATLETLEVGQRLEGTVTRLAKFGAFVDIGGVDGLIPIGELAHRSVPAAAASSSTNASNAYVTCGPFGSRKLPVRNGVSQISGRLTTLPTKRVFGIAY